MPWRETAPRRERGRFIVNYESGLYTMSELCERFGVSRKTGYKWVARDGGEGLAGLADRARPPHYCPHRTETRVIDALVRARRQHPAWGPRKLISWLAKHHPECAWPAPSTAGDILKQAGLTNATHAPTPARAPRQDTGAHGRPERWVEYGLQGRVSNGRRAVVLSPDGGRWGESVLTRLRG